MNDPPKMVHRSTYNGSPYARYVQINPGTDVYCVLPSQVDEPLVYGAHCKGAACDAGYVCLHYNCYVDKPTDSFRKLYVCGNY